MQPYHSIFVYGFALFAMFFGSGNLVFPLQIGHTTGAYWLLGFVGLFITGILLPFLGLFVIKLHRGSYRSFFGEAGSVAQVLLPLFTLSLLGAFGVVPRCITVAHGGMSYLMPELPLSIFSILFCIPTFFFCLKDQRMLNILGKWMSPVLLVTLIVLVVTGILQAPALTTDPALQPQAALYDGFLTGYQTMDLFAAFFFSALIFTQIQQAMPPEATHRDTLRFAVKSSLLGAGLLALIYLGFVFLGAHYAPSLENVAPEFMLPAIAKQVMGKSATFFIAIAMVFSCLTTAVALNNIYARYLASLFKIKEAQFWVILLMTTVVSFFISLLNFKGIAAFLAPALEISYPGIILLTLLGIITRKWHLLKMVGFYGISLYMVGMLFL